MSKENCISNMKKKIGVIPTIILKNNHLNVIIETKALNFLKKKFSQYELILLYEKKKIYVDIVVSLGGNTIYDFEKKRHNLYRFNLDKYYLKKSIKNKIPFLGICYGAQFLSYFFKSNIKKKDNHTNVNHKINFFNGKNYYVNSFHDYSVISLGKNLKSLAWSDDGSIEAFRHKKHKILGIMWHPERKGNNNILEKILFKNFL